MPLGGKEENSFVRITLTSHGGSSCNDFIVANTKNLNVPKKMQKTLKLLIAQLLCCTQVQYELPKLKVMQEAKLCWCFATPLLLILLNL
jgi:hypothetical protein